MRTMLKVRMDTAAANGAVADGSLREIMQGTLERLRPEAAYFTADAGRRTAMIFFDLADPADIPSIAEPLFGRLNAELEFLPVMNRDDLERGLAQVGRGAGAAAS